jgi:transposase
MTENPTTVSPIGRRSLAILLHSQGYSLSRISQTLGVSKSSARRYILA